MDVSTPEGTFLRPTCKVPNCDFPVPMKGQKCSWHELPERERRKRRERPGELEWVEYKNQPEEGSGD